MKMLKTIHYVELGSYPSWPVLLPQKIRLYTFEQLPMYLRENPYITDGYRAHLPSKLCLRSIFILSNETVNIWSHLLGFLLFFSLSVNDVVRVLPASGASREDYIIYAIGLFCFQFWRQVYSLTVLCMILLVCGAQFHPRYMTAEWRCIRVSIFFGIAVIGVVPTCHWVLLNGGLTCDIVKMFLPRLIVMYLIGAAAFVFYITKMPERCFPGHVNYVGASHQVWHVLVVAMLYWWHQTAVDIMQFRLSQPCP
ncbi:progestin and adipoQ receptor family member 3-like isoform X2 [Phyllopteryx taeniolatus]|uniref:progestin and adipoQ receptor family member 3-like isoform X2 n=1 Tax=Phyllopteryx taeniolatus TaxID=161469 RepID=UPI002AD47E0D|nr:progestin and adipoQ receptor family member 3-like isoform X2 [Phyllopteryx taeniolatus]